MKKTITASLLLLSSLGLHAQSGTNSPYSQYGLGELSEQSGSFSRGMNGLAYGLRLNNQVNALNPASYSALDSLSFIFDAGVSLQMTQFKEGGRSISARNADLEYVVAGLRLFRHVGVSFGLLPYTNVGYDYSNSAHINGSLSPESPTATYNNKYSGSQGLHQVYLGVGAEPLRNLSVGVNASYLWGGYTKYVTNTYSDAYVNTLQRTYTAEVRSYKLDFGLQFTQPLSAKDQVTLGLTYSLGHSLNADPELSVIKNNSQLAVADTTHFRISNALDLPHTFGVGAVYSHNGQLMVGADYQLPEMGQPRLPAVFRPGRLRAPERTAQGPPQGRPRRRLLPRRAPPWFPQPPPLPCGYRLRHALLHHQRPGRPQGDLGLAGPGHPHRQQLQQPLDAQHLRPVGAPRGFLDAHGEHVPHQHRFHLQ